MHPWYFLVLDTSMVFKYLVHLWYLLVPDTSVSVLENTPLDFRYSGTNSTHKFIIDSF